MGLKFFVDHCISNEIIHKLRDLVISKANELDSILVSLNGDFTDIVTYPPSNYNGIIALQVRNHPETIPYLLERLKNYLSVFSDMSHYNGRLLLVEAHRIRVRG